MICFCRIDDRLIHGQVVTTWVNAYDIEQIIVVNDKIAGDKTQKNILTMAAPQGIKVHAFGVKEFAEIAQTNPIKRRTMLLFTTSIDVYDLVRGGVEIKELNIGGMRYQEGRQTITKAVAVTPQEREAFKKLLEGGMKGTIQMVPKEPAVDLEGVI